MGLALALIFILRLSNLLHSEHSSDGFHCVILAQFPLFSGSWSLVNAKNVVKDNFSALFARYNRAEMKAV